ncbi:MAG: hypothetical protein ACK48W_12930 [Bacteroidota bacterium]|jgi:hypothetical protein
MTKKKYYFFILSLISANCFNVFSQEVKNDEPKHYIKPTFYINRLVTGKRTFKSNKNENYSFAQSNFGFYFPIYTNTKPNVGDKIGSVFQIIGTGNVSRAIPKFNFISSKHTLVRTNFGLSAMLNTGTKNVFFANVLPFIAEDRSSLQYKPSVRLTYMFIYNRTVSERFSYRIGYAKTYLLSGSPRQPILGIRVGKFDRFHFNFQYPRYVSFDWPLDEHITISFFNKVMGGIYGMRNVEFRGDTYNSVLFKRQEKLTGVEWDYKSDNLLSFFFSAGFVGNNSIILNEVSSKKINRYFLDVMRSNFIAAKLEPSLFINLGVQLSFGKAKKIYNNLSMYDAIDMNGTFGNGDNNDAMKSAPIPYIPSQLKLKAIQLKDVEDLFELEDIN